MSCFYLGDSIALGLAMLNPQCGSDAVIGRSTPAIIRHAPRQAYDIVVISAGTNDAANERVSASLLRNLVRLRIKIAARTVIWVLPANGSRSSVYRVATYFRDRIVSFDAGRDGIHPMSYPSLQSRIRAASVE